MTNEITPATDESGIRMDSPDLIINGLRCELGIAKSEVALKQLTIEALQSEIAGLRGLERAVNEYHRVFGLECLVCSECRGRCELEIYPDGECECCCHDISRASKGEL